MARRKRASLKDKDPETLGLTPKKGKGIDMLFGGPIEKSSSTTSESSPEESKASSVSATTAASSEQNNDESATEVPEQSSDEENNSAEDEIPVVVPPAAPSVETEAADAPPVNEADDDSTVITSSEEFDELGLPVAMEAPPSDLEFAPMSAETTADSSEKDAFDPSLSPFAAPPPSTDDLSGLVDDNDLSGLLEEDDLSGLASEPPPPLPTDSSATITDDLAGLGEEEEVLSGFGTQPDTTTPSTTVPPATLPSAPPPIDTTPETVPSQPEPALSSPPPPSAEAAAPGATTQDTARGPFRRTGIESLGGIITEKIEVSDEDILPADVARQVETSNVIGVTERTEVEKDEAKAAEVIRYLGAERRENLDKQIEGLYEEVAAELSVNTKDAEYALEKLSEAQDIILEDARDYDRALYLVAVVKTMLARKRNLRRWSYTWGSFVFFYALIWLIAFLAGFLFTDAIRDALGTSSSAISAIRAAWLSALAGGVGGIIGIFYSLYWHVAMKQDFDRQYVMYYLVQPIMGFVLGAVIYFIIGAGFILVNFATDPNGSTQEVLASETVVAIQIIFGWIAGFRQRVVFEMIDKIVQRVLPRDEDTNANPVSLAPADERGQTPPPGEEQNI